MTEEEFITRFKTHMLKIAKDLWGMDEFEGGGSIAEYAEKVAPTYWADPLQREDGPEQCAQADLSYWGGLRNEPPNFQKAVQAGNGGADRRTPIFWRAL